MEPKDELLEAMLRRVAPRAPRGFAQAVERRIASRARQRRRLMWTAAVGLAAAALAVLLVRPTERPLQASPWRMAELAAPVTLTRDGRGAVEARAGMRLPVGGVVEIGPRASALLVDDREHQVMLAQGAKARVEGRTLVLEDGVAELRGDDARLDSAPAAVTAIGPDAAVGVEMRRVSMSEKDVRSIAVGALLAVTVSAGAARVHAAGQTVLLARNERAVVGGGLPALVLRAPVAAVKNGTASARDTGLATPGATTNDTADATRGVTTKGDTAAATTQPELGESNKEVVRTAIRATLNDVKTCYEFGLERNPRLAGRIVVQLAVVNRNGKGVVKDAQVVPQDGASELRSPAVEHCILAAISRAQFPISPQDGPTIITYPIVLKSQP
jgi:hypothetical protein